MAQVVLQGTHYQRIEMNGRIQDLQVDRELYRLGEKASGNIGIGLVRYSSNDEFVKGVVQVIDVKQQPHVQLQIDLSKEDDFTRVMTFIKEIKSSDKLESIKRKLLQFKKSSGNVKKLLKNKSSKQHGNTKKLLKKKSSKKKLLKGRKRI